MEREVATEPSNDDGDDGDDHLSIMTGRSPRPHIDKVTVTNDESSIEVEVGVACYTHSSLIQMLFLDWDWRM
eukprot:scaffold107643_cov45-Attheya_sp.AAC.2